MYKSNKTCSGSICQKVQKTNTKEIKDLRDTVFLDWKTQHCKDDNSPKLI